MKGEFIGRELSIIAAKNKAYTTMHGTIINETKNTLTIIHDGKEKTLLKKGTVFSIDGATIKGDAIQKRPEDRSKP